MRIPLLLAIAPLQPSVERAMLLSVVAGFVSSGSLLFIVFNFMMTIVADFAEIAIRMGALEMGRYVMQWLIMAYTFYVDPSSIQGTKATPITFDLTSAVLPLAAFAFVMDLVPGFLLFFAPGPYRDDRFPNWAIGMIWKRKSFLLLAASDLLGALISFPASLYVVWWLLHGWTASELTGVSVAAGVACGLGMGLWAWILHVMSRHGQSVIVPMVLLLAPPTILQVMVEAEVSTTDAFPRSNWAMAISIYALMLEGIRLSSFWMARIKILKDRWRLLSYTTWLLAAMAFIQFLSPIFCQRLALSMHLDGERLTGFAAADQWSLVRTIEAVVIWPVPIALLQYLAQMLAAPWINEDMEVAIGATHNDNMDRMWRWLQRMKVLIVLVFGVAVLTSVAVITITTKKAIELPEMHEPVWPCPLRRLPNCTMLAAYSSSEVAVYGTINFGLNRFRQPTTARANCFKAMETAGGNAFATRAAGECKVFFCDSAEQLESEHASPMSDDWTVFSQKCSYKKENVIAVHLFEWRWDDIAKECEEYLGPAGFNVVQVSPPAEHILGTTWSTRYQPVSYRLNSRSGSEDMFVEMVRRCAQAGVAIMVDAVINHMASTFDMNGQQCKNDACKGFSGTLYGSREFWGSKSQQGPAAEMAVYSMEMFHHSAGDVTSNCAWGPGTFDADRYLCDMRSLPDINTEYLPSQMMLLRYLFGLFEIGVTHIRIDAASNIYAASLNSIINRIPWTYVVQEFYSQDLLNNLPALKNGHVTDFEYGMHLASGGKLFDDFNGDWVDTTSKFGDMLWHGINQRWTPSEHEGLIFMANHDSQREAWQRDHPPDPSSHGYCTYTGPGSACSPIYKHGEQYNLAQLFMLAWPWSNNLRMLSSYAFSEFHQGPPLVPSSNLNKSESLSVWTDQSARYPQRCKHTPDTSPVKDDWEFAEDTPWVCEHRWTGVVGMVQFRRELFAHTIDDVHGRWDDKMGHAAYNIGDVAFVAMSRGFSWYTGHGPNASFDLKNFSTSLPVGEYCNMALFSDPDRRTWTCSGGDRISIDADGTIRRGTLRNGGIVAIHARHPAPGPSEAIKMDKEIAHRASLDSEVSLVV
eukprot:TRINITY_DN2846_c0_g1_i1.p1 TRINITY_DN2846_c0_g1~~TRINITY_DN2846_c0_g1_i1.p1  ORF type:complete len:1089 (-),score=180.98 TRINITY_DN2846_c0_g1_i1:31-3297(-)